jgi:hypothetical protein
MFCDVVETHCDVVEIHREVRITRHRPLYSEKHVWQSGAFRRDSLSLEQHHKYAVRRCFDVDAYDVQCIRTTFEKLKNSALLTSIWKVVAVMTVYLSVKLSYTQIELGLLIFFFCFTYSKT